MLGCGTCKMRGEGFSPKKSRVQATLQPCPAVLLIGSAGLFSFSLAGMCWDPCSLPQRLPLVDLNPLLGFPGSCLNEAARAPKHPLAAICHPQASVLPSLLQGYCSISSVPKHSISSHLTSREWGILLRTPQAPGVRLLPPGSGEMLEVSEPDLCRKGSSKHRGVGSAEPCP